MVDLLIEDHAKRYLRFPDFLPVNPILDMHPKIPPHQFVWISSIVYEIFQLLFELIMSYRLKISLEHFNYLLLVYQTLLDLCVGLIRFFVKQNFSRGHRLISFFLNTRSEFRLFKLILVFIFGLIEYRPVVSHIVI